MRRVRPWILLTVVAFVLIPAGCGGSDTEGPKGPPPPTAVELARKRLTELGADTVLTDADAAWKRCLTLRKEAASAAAAGQAPEALSVFNRAALEAERKVLELNPDHAERRAELKQVRYSEELTPYFDAPYLLDVDRSAARKIHDALMKKGKSEHGWMAAAALEPMAEFMTRVAPDKAKYEASLASPFFAAAEKLRQEVTEDLNQRFLDRIGHETNPWRGIVMIIHEPFVFFIQQDPSWDPLSVARSRARELEGVQDIILTEYGEVLGLKPVDVPVPVLMFRSYDDYQKYSGLPGAYAHFEPHSTRLAIHDDCDHRTVMHEGTHQLMHFWTKNPPPVGQRAYWWNEGIAEWYSGASREMDPKTKQWTYKIGRLHQGRMGTLAALRGSERMKEAYKMKELISTRYVPHKAEAESSGRVGSLYAEAWFLIYFLNNFNVNAEGYVEPDQPGIYREGWRRYVRSSLEGKGGLPVFLEALEMKVEDLERLDKEFWDYFEFVRRKDNLGQVIDGLVVKHDHPAVHRGKKREDLLLPPE